MVMQRIPPDYSQQGWTDHVAGSPFTVPAGTTVTRQFNINPATRLVVVSFRTGYSIATYQIVGGSSGAVLASASVPPVPDIVYVPIIPALDSYVTVTVTAFNFSSAIVSLVALEQDFTPFIVSATSSPNPQGSAGISIPGTWRSSYTSLAIRDTTTRIFYDTGAYADGGVQKRTVKINTNLNQPVDIQLGIVTDSGMTLNGGGDYFMALAHFSINGATSNGWVVNSSGVYPYGANAQALIAGSLAFLDDPAERLQMVTTCSVAPTTGLMEMVYTRYM